MSICVNAKSVHTPMNHAWSSVALKLNVWTGSAPLYRVTRNVESKHVALQVSVAPGPALDGSWNSNPIEYTGDGIVATRCSGALNARSLLLRSVDHSAKLNPRVPENSCVEGGDMATSRTPAYGSPTPSNVPSATAPMLGKFPATTLTA